MRQITIITPIRGNPASEIISMLAEAGINLESMDAMDIQNHHVLTLSVDRYDDALRLLRDSGYHAVTEDAVVIRVKDEPGALAKVTQRLDAAGVHLRSMRLLYRQEGQALVAVCMDPTARGAELLEDLLVRNIGG
jgi:hypothetical protein